MSTTFIGNISRLSKSEPWNSLWDCEETDEVPENKEKESPRLFEKHSHTKKFDNRAKSAKNVNKPRQSDIPNKHINSITNFNIWLASS